MSLRNVYVTEAQLREELERRVTRMGSQAKLARRLRMSAPLISNIIQGNANVCGKVLRWLGYERVVMYRRRKDRE